MRIVILSRQPDLYSTRVLAAATLAAAGADVVRLETPVPHMVDPVWIEPLREVVARATA